MSKEDDGGPAFPEMKTVGEHGDYWTEHTSGMTLRDYFAARMMAYQLAQEIGVYQRHNYINAAVGAYAMADAMLEVRKR